MTAPIRSVEDLVHGLRVARDERELTHELIDALSGLASGHTSKILAGIKKPGPVSLFPLLGALGKALEIVDDPEQIKRISKRWQKRRGPPEWNGNRSASILTELEKALEALGKLSHEERKKYNRSIGGKRRAKALKKRTRQRIATHAARMRWAKTKPRKLDSTV